MKKLHFLIVLFLCGLSIGNLCASASAAAAAEEAAAGALIKAVRYGKEEKVGELLDEGADVDSIGPVGMTALMFAAWRGDADMVKLLLSHGANKYLKNKYGQTAEILARGVYEELADIIRDYRPSGGLTKSALKR